VAPVLEIDDLHMHFFTRDGVVKAVDGVTFTLDARKTLGVVGESAREVGDCPLDHEAHPEPPGKVVSGDIPSRARASWRMSEKEQRKLRGNRIADDIPGSMTSLNPVYRIGKQISEPLRLHKGLSRKEAWDAAVELLDRVGIPSGQAGEGLPARVLRRHETAGHDRMPSPAAPRAHSRRTHHRART